MKVGQIIGAPKQLSKVQLPTISDVLHHHFYLKNLVSKDKKKNPAAARFNIKVAETVENQNSNIWYIEQIFYCSKNKKIYVKI
jgi:hypothetical protein